MWLPETAADLETLDILAELGIRFTILAPHQASRVRRIGDSTWHDVSGGRVDPTMPYLLRLPSGRRLTLFFYDGPISRAVAFEGLLTQGELFAHRLASALSQERTWPQLVHIATDGETYGHHHRHGDMALAYALHYVDANYLARLTNYGAYLEKHRPTHLAEIIEVAPEGTRNGSRPGAHRCGRPWIGAGIPWPPPTRRTPASSCGSPGRPGTITSALCWIGQRRTWSGSCASTPPARSMPLARSGPSSCWNCNAT
jgi:hypothetical protein